MSLKYGSYGYELWIRKLERDEYNEWDAFVEKSPQGTVFHKASWLTLFEDFKFEIVACFHKEGIVAGMPLPYKRRYGMKLAIHPPFTSYLGVIFRESCQKYNVRLSFEKELSRILGKSVKDFAPYLIYNFHYNFVDPLPFIYAGFSVKPRFHYVLNLEKASNAILEDMEKDTRNRIVRASKYNLEISDGSPSEMANLMFLSFESKNRRPPYSSKQVLERQLDIFHRNNMMKSIIVKDKHELLAGGSIGYDGTSAYYLLGSTTLERKYKGMGPLVIWMLLKYAKEVLGLSKFDFLMAQNENIERFYRGFGGKLSQSYFVYKDNMTYRLTNAMVKVKSKVLQHF